ncbi:Ig-like domain-containing protein [Marivirga salinae]|uniref:Ig-like domain-containing protein n=1 Tax=Marivirga salinarum TaxID=3059078 RepID=A0AA51RDR2_9BACT|nr:Ig-like domain-containing protein [Marivirga sp. BDSF4-3]WMN10904.1 Ig-like domain-containing protein [Marivirga sp. BDSF4-3]
MEKLFTKLIFVIACLWGAAPWVQAQDVWTEVGTAMQGTANEGFGAAVSISADGTIVAIGAPSSDAGGTEFSLRGSVEIYELQSGSWVQKGSTINGTNDGASFGQTLSLSDDGTKLAIGAPTNSSSSINAGLVQIYNWNSTTSDWDLIHFIDGDAVENRLGAALSLSGDGNILAIGAPLHAGGGSARGRVSVYAWDGTVWQSRENINGSTDNSGFGSAVSLDLDGDVLAIGAPDNGANLEGQFTTYSWNSTNYTNTGTFDGVADEYLGQRVSLSDNGNLLAVSAVNFFLGGASVSIYNYTTSWSLQETLTSAIFGDNFGISISMSGDGSRLGIGANNNVTGNENGRAEIYEFNGANWTLVEQAITGEAVGDEAGYSLSLSQEGMYAAIGAHLNDAGGADAGHVRVFQQGAPDTTPPTVTIDTLYTSDQTPALTGDVDDNDATVSVTVNGDAYDATNNGDGTWTLRDNIIQPVLNEGEYTISATATNALEISSEPVEGYLKIDLTDPDFFFLNGNLTGLNLFTEPVNEQPLLVTIAFGEEVTALNLQDIQINGQVGTTALAFVEDEAGNYYSLTIPLLDASVDQQVTVTLPMGAVTDLAGNPNPGKSVTISYDGTAPAVTAIEPIGTNTTNMSTIPIQIVFDEETIAFESTDLAVTNVSSVSDLTTEDNLTYTMNVIPAVEGALTVQLPLGAVEDLAGNTNAVASELLEMVYDVTSPTVEITTAANAVSTSPVMATVTFSEAVQSLVVEDLTITNGTVTAVSTEDNITYTLEITPDEVAEGNTSTAGIVVTIDLEADKVLDIAGNGNTAAPTSISVTFDNQAPEINLTNDMYVPLTAVNGDFTAYFVISEPVSTFDITDINVTNGTKSNFVEENIFGTIRYSVDIALTGTEDVVIEISADAITDALGFGNLATTFNIAVDVVGPIVEITSNASNPTNETPIPVIFTFNEETTGFAAEDIAEGNFTASKLNTEDNLVYTSNITPTANGELNISLKDASVTDLAGNFNTNTGSFTITFDDVAPTVTIGGPDAVNSNEPFTVTFTFNEAITGLESSNITLENASRGAITQEGNMYSTPITPSGAGDITISVVEFSDLAGNSNTSPGESASKTITFDATRPTLAVTGTPETAVTSKDPITFTFTFSEPVVDFVLTDIAVTNASASDLTDNNPIFTAKITPEAVGTITIDIAENIVTDAAGNGNEAASASFELQQKYSGGTGTEADPYLISNAEDFKLISKEKEDWASFFLQTSDLNFEGNYIYTIGGSTGVFSGTYDGGGFKLVNFKAHTTGNFYLREIGSLFNSLSSLGRISNLSIENDISKNDYDLDYTTTYSVLVNLCEGIIDNCSFKGNINLSNDRSLSFGGLVVDLMRTGEISNSTFDGNVSLSLSDGVSTGKGGGLAATVHQGAKIINSSSYGQFEYSAGELVKIGGIAYVNSGTIQDSHSYMTMQGKGNTSGNTVSVDGLVAENRSTGIIQSCYTTSQLEASGESSIGFGAVSSSGITGNNKGIIRNSYTTGNSPMVNYNEASGTISNSFAVLPGRLGIASINRGTIKDSYAVLQDEGSLVLINNVDAIGTISNCYIIAKDNQLNLGTLGGNVINSFWLSDSETGSSQNGALPKTHNQLRNKGTFTEAGWDFTNVWHYPWHFPIHKWVLEGDQKLKISGKVVDENGNAFTSGTVIGYQYQKGNPTAEIDASGNFTIELSTGVNNLWVLPSNTDEYDITYLGSTNSPLSQRIIYYNKSNVTIKMVRKTSTNKMTGNGSVSGKVVSSSSGGRIVQGRILQGNPLEGVKVFLVRTSDEEIMTNVVTDANGDFEITGIPAGEYQLILDVAGIDLNLEGSTFTMDEEGTPLTISAAVSEEGVSFAIEEVLGIENEIEVAVYPNPVKDFVNIQVPGKASIRVIDINGVVVKEEQFTDFIQLDIQGLHSNMYFLEIRNGSGKAMRKLIKK